MSLTDFGFQKVDFQEKTRRVRGVFERVSPHYDRMNDLMSLGIHRFWKKQMVADIPFTPQMTVLDVAGGTGDISLMIKKKYPYLDLDLILCDITPSMIHAGRDKALNKGITQGIEWVCGNAEHLPFPNSSIDVYTIAFGLRNITHREAALREAYRVLKPGGVFACLEFSQVQCPPLSHVYDFYSFAFIPWLGGKVGKDRESYQYLVESIRCFPSQEELATLLKETGMQTVSWKNFMNGVCSLHMAKK